ncbi:MAG TPA: hypothetical protein VFA18_21615, partial [Gemmataceae bacterium]|nr:hypothetical protein [Gemmataceae bacterium]
MSSFPTFLGKSLKRNRALASGHKARRARPALSVRQFEQRIVPTVVFDPQFAKESIIPPPPMQSYTVLNSPKLYLIFWGNWSSSEASQWATDAHALVTSSYLYELMQYTSDGQATWGGYWIDGTNPIPSGYNPAGSSADANGISSQTDMQNEIAYAINNSSTTGILAPPAGKDVTQSPVYVVLPDPTHSNGTNAGYNVPGTYGSSGINMISIGTSGNVEQFYQQRLSHELAERMTDPKEDGSGVNIQYSTSSSFPAFVNTTAPNVNNNPSQAGNQPYLNNSGQIGDGEQEPGGFDHYTYQLTSLIPASPIQIPVTFTVQSLWSNSTLDSTGSAGAFVVDDGNSQTIYLQPIWTQGSIAVPGTGNPSANPPVPPVYVTGPVFTGTYNLVIRGDDQPPSGLDPTVDDTIVVNASDTEVDVTLDGQVFVMPNFVSDGGQINTIYVQPGQGTNSVTIQGLAADQTLWVQDGSLSSAGGNATDTITVGNNGNMTNVLGQVVVTNNFGTATVDLNIDDSQDSAVAGRTVTMGVSSSQPTGVANPYSVSFSGLGTVIYASADVLGLNVTGDAYGNTMDVLATPAPVVTTLTGNGPDTVVVGDTGHTVQGIQGTLSVYNNSSSTTVEVDDAWDRVQHSNVQTGIEFNDSGPAFEDIINLAQAPINLAIGEVGPVTILGGTAPGGNVYQIYGTFTNGNTLLKTGAGDLVDVNDTTGSLSIDGNGANNTVVIGNSGLLTSITGQVSVENENPGTTALTIDDSADPNNHVTVPVTISSTSVTGLAPATISYDPASLSALNVDVGYNNPNYGNGTPAAQSVYDIVSTPSLTTTTTLISGGLDTVNVGNAGSVASIVGSLYLYNIQA